jgi:hypothetical protein
LRVGAGDGRADAAGHLLSAPEAKGLGYQEFCEARRDALNNGFPGPSRTPDGAIRCREVDARHRRRGNSRRSPPIRHLRPNTGTCRVTRWGHHLGRSTTVGIEQIHTVATAASSQPDRAGDETSIAAHRRRRRPIPAPADLTRIARAARLRRSRAGGARRALGLPRHPRLPAARAHRSPTCATAASTSASRRSCPPIPSANGSPPTSTTARVAGQRQPTRTCSSTTKATVGGSADASACPRRRSARTGSSTRHTPVAATSARVCGLFGLSIAGALAAIP